MLVIQRGDWHVVRWRVVTKRLPEPQTAYDIGLSLFLRWMVFPQVVSIQQRGVGGGEGREQTGRRAFLTCGPVGWYMPRAGGSMTDVG